jgi:hypothetical protein
MGVGKEAVCRLLYDIDAVCCCFDLLHCLIFYVFPPYNAFRTCLNNAEHGPQDGSLLD